MLVRLISYLRANEYDIIHAHQPHGMVFARLANLVAGRRPIVSTHHNINSSYDPVFGELERLTRRFNRVTTGVSNAVVDSFTDQKEPIRTDWTVVYNGLNCSDWANSVEATSRTSADLSDDLGLSDNQFVFLNVGRYVPQKHQALLIEATDRLVSTHPDVRVLLVGWGRLEERYRQLVEDLNLGSNVTITGRVPQPEPYYALADCFVLCSKHEGLPVTLIEASAAGLPLIGTDVPGISEVVEDGVNGYLTRSGDVDQLADAMLRMISTNRGDSFAKASRELCVERFDISNVVDAYNDIYLSLV
jgi:glycosyltransferase involved in cell wall biosynthesis